MKKYFPQNKSKDDKHLKTEVIISDLDENIVNID